MKHWIVNSLSLTNEVFLLCTKLIRQGSKNHEFDATDIFKNFLKTFLKMRVYELKIMAVAKVEKECKFSVKMFVAFPTRNKVTQETPLL